MGDCNTIVTIRRPHHCDPHLDQTKYNDLLLLTIDGVLDVGHYLFESCKIIHLRQSSCLTNIACLFFTGLGGAVADR